MEVNFEEQSNTMIGIVQQIVFEKNLHTKLEATDTIINSLNMSIAKKTRAYDFQKYLHRLFEDSGFMRQLLNVSTIKDNIELAMEYSGFDFVNEPDLFYDVEFEKKLLVIRKKLSRFLGNLLRELSDTGLEVEM